jgi:hypothetical protein
MHTHITLCMDRSIIFLCGLKYWTGHHSQGIQTMQNCPSGRRQVWINGL